MRLHIDTDARTAAERATAAAVLRAAAELLEQGASRPAVAADCAAVPAPGEPSEPTPQPAGMD
ncbi:hypothetical protein CKO31_22950 [Thiohalocapsa halophila]|uniref:DUF2191 domain-containing protein n=1 Tax=Thiohalocapsa halophila TaxID=69359 RepID=A0ABS1CNT8_9GAMM|nr:hypothetical protein [Thiohalocapsa halophila]MBK1633550.1 hypothetical protein [Thiohalocapsa halophila]